MARMRIELTVCPHLVVQGERESCPKREACRHVLYPYRRFFGEDESDVDLAE